MRYAGCAAVKPRDWPHGVGWLPAFSKLTRWINVLDFLVFSLPNAGKKPSTAWAPEVALSMVNANISFFIAVMVLTSTRLAVEARLRRRP